MDPIGNSIASSVAGVSQQERIASRDRARQAGGDKDRFRRALDEAELTTTQVEAAEAVRSAKGNDSEESHEDRQQRGDFDETPPAHPAPPKPRLDING